MQLFMQRLTLLFLLITVIIAMVTMGLSWRADNASSELKRLEKQIEEVKILIRVLEGEWSQLNRPERLKALADQYLDIQKLPAYNQIEDIRQLPTHEEFERAKNKQEQEEKEDLIKAEKEEAEKKRKIEEAKIAESQTVEKQKIEPYEPIENIISEIDINEAIESDPINALIEKE